MKLIAKLFAVAAVAVGLNSHAEGGKREVEPIEASIFMAVLPMNAEDANSLVRKLVSKGLKGKWVAMLGDYFRTTERFNSMPLLLPARNSYLCVATALRYDIDNVSRFAPAQDLDTRMALRAYLLAHEASHCKEFIEIIRRDKGWAKKSASELSDIWLWQEESLADIRARRAVKPLGVAGQNARAAWELYRLYNFLEGDLNHWSTPLTLALDKDTDSKRSDVVQASIELGGEDSYNAISEGWRQLCKALFSADDESSEQQLAWDQALNIFPEGMRKAIPQLSELRVITKRIWPEAPDWRLKAIGRVRPPQ